jgi:predicted small secreted protein
MERAARGVDANRRARVPQANQRSSLMKLFTRLFSLAVITSICFAVPACNTMEGAGKDIKKTGEKIEDSADRNK